ncbi:MAG: DNA-protecting protein DprA [Saprospiraceae bacterium]|nr:DNA-protecting protein DprA [Saprospiraceae bacterium]
MDTLQHQIALTLIPQVGAVTAKTLVSYCGSAQAVFRATKKDLRKIPGIGSVIIENIQRSNALELAERELLFIEEHGIHPLFYTDPRFPARLLQSYDCPNMLFYKGSDIGLLNSEKIVSVVGTRQPTEHGKAVCEELIEGLAGFGVLIVSGLAYGIDVTAHRKSCAINVPNIGVLGHGLGSIYPSAHRSIAFKMLENGGLISEYGHKTQPDRENFPMRNRVIAGMCDALIVVETAASGGSMITASIASRLSCEVFSVPGRPSDSKSAGCNYLIRTHQAHLIENAADLASVMRWDEPKVSKRQQTQLMLNLDPTEHALIDTVRNHPEISIDSLSLALNLPPGELASRLLALEFRGALKTLPGKRYVALG